ncbi:hypothetical protein VKT23_019302 [Stygiomarasmius scandens]|uniref:Uncharacterized protein n=1 Tax=Marasmiellus scandens TaxID=2682957 RepID=A0ABR1IQQ1_9AGAR
MLKNSPAGEGRKSTRKVVSSTSLALTTSHSSQVLHSLDTLAAKVEVGSEIKSEQEGRTTHSPEPMSPMSEGANPPNTPASAVSDTNATDAPETPPSSLRCSNRIHLELVEKIRRSTTQLVWPTKAARMEARARAQASASVAPKSKRFKLKKKSTKKTLLDLGRRAAPSTSRVPESPHSQSLGILRDLAGSFFALTSRQGENNAGPSKIPKRKAIGRKKRTIEEPMEEEEVTSDDQSSTYEDCSDSE